MCGSVVVDPLEVAVIAVLALNEIMKPRLNIQLAADPLHFLNDV